MASPFERAAIDAYASKTSWDAAVTGILGSMLERWRLTDAQVFPATAAAVVAGVRRSDGTPAVLKIGFPHPEAIWEAAALDALPVDVAPALLDQDVWTWAMLLERLAPGSTLADDGVPAREAVGIGAALHRRLAAATPPPGLPALADQYRPLVARLAEDAALPLLAAAGLGDAEAGHAVEEFGRLCDTAPVQALLHGDLNPTNILRHGTGWRVLDPKPAIGDPAFDTFSLVRDLLTDPGSRDELASLTEAAARTAGIDRDRAIRWMRVRGTLSAFWNAESGLLDDARRDVTLVLSAHDLPTG